MKETASTTWTFQMMIFFMLIFMCFLCLTLVYSKAFSIRNRMLTIIEKYEGVTSESAGIINNYIIQKSYTTTGKCPTDGGYIGATSIEGNGHFEAAVNGTKYYYCFKEKKNNDGIYYEVIVFYKFNLPVLGEIATYQLKGETKTFLGSNDRIKY